MPYLETLMERCKKEWAHVHILMQYIQVAQGIWTETYIPIVSTNQDLKNITTTIELEELSVLDTSQ
jgi:hypothetical protein